MAQCKKCGEIHNIATTFVCNCGAVYEIEDKPVEKPVEKSVEKPVEAVKPAIVPEPAKRVYKTYK
jgi:hypothetical protein